MKTSIISPNMSLNDKLQRAAEQRISDVLSRIVDRIQHVSITLTDENGLRGGVDKHCRVQVSVRGLEAVVTEGEHEDILASIDQALRRARSVILKRLKRRIDRSRKQPDIFVESENTHDVAMES